MSAILTITRTALYGKIIPNPCMAFNEARKKEHCANLNFQ